MGAGSGVGATLATTGIAAGGGVSAVQAASKPMAASAASLSGENCAVLNIGYLSPPLTGNPLRGKGEDYSPVNLSPG